MDYRTAVASFDTYCDKWKLRINITKTKIIVCSYPFWQATGRNNGLA